MAFPAATVRAGDQGEPDSGWRLGGSSEASQSRGAVWPAESSWPPRDLGELSQPMGLCWERFLEKKGVLAKDRVTCLDHLCLRLSDRVECLENSLY